MWCQSHKETALASNSFPDSRPADFFRTWDEAHQHTNKLLLWWALHNCHWKWATLWHSIHTNDSLNAYTYARVLTRVKKYSPSALFLMLSLFLKICKKLTDVLLVYNMRKCFYFLFSTSLAHIYDSSLSLKSFWIFFLTTFHDIFETHFI